jgi:CheY-like chemotaxis protein
VTISRVRLIHWNAVEAKERRAVLEGAGYSVDSDVPAGATFLRKLRENVPLAVIIDLSRLPSQGRDLALMLRKSKATPFIPLIFAGGEEQKVKRIRDLLPDAVYTPWSRIRSGLKQAVANPPPQPVSPGSVFEAYRGAPLPTKLGIKPGSVVSLIGAPPDFESQLGHLPSGVVLKHRSSKRFNLTISFNRSRRELKRHIRSLVTTIGDGKLWIVWPKRGGSLTSDLSQQFVRKEGLAAGLVDFKICAINETWSGLLFTRRRAK